MKDAIKAKRGLEIAKETVLAMNDINLELDKECFPNLSNNTYIDSSYYQKMGNAEYIDSQLVTLKNDVEGASRLLSKIDKNETKKRQIRIFKLVSSVAASIFAVSFLFYLVIERSQSRNLIVIDNNYARISAPTIILESGEQITLDEKPIKITEEGISKEQGRNAVAYSGRTTTKQTNESQEKIVYNSIVIPCKYTYNVILADGSEVILNAGSKLTYPTKFGGNSREVILDGEAYFKVKKSDVPFIVIANKIKVKVYGTEFNINTTFGITETVLVKGAIGITESNDLEVMLKPNDMYTLNHKTGDSKIMVVNPNNYVAWLSNNFNYTNTNLKVFIERISAWYGVKFICNNPAIDNINIDIFADRNSSIEELTNILEKLTNFKFIREEESVYTIK